MKYSDGLCKICKTGQYEDIKHLLYGCNEIKETWKLIEEIIQNSFGHPIKINYNESISGFWNTNAIHTKIQLCLINVLLGICRYHIWKIRNSIKYGNENINFIQRRRILKFDLKTHIHILISSVNTQNIKGILKGLETHIMEM